MGKALASYTIIKDTREHDNHGWVFEAEEKKPGKPQIVGMIEQCLDAGDYSIVGLEDKIRIERKNGFAELFGNYADKEHKERMIRECEKLRVIPHKYIVIETNLMEDTLGLGVPQMKFGPPVKRVVDWLLELQLEYNLVPIFAGDAGKYVAKSIFNQMARKYLS